MAFYPASQLKPVCLALLTWTGASVSVYGQSGDSSLLLSTEVVVKTGDTTGAAEIDFNFFDGVEIFMSDKVVFYASTNAPVPNFNVNPEGSGFYFNDLETDIPPLRMVGTDDTAPEVELGGVGFLFEDVPNGAWEVSENGLVVYNATIKGAEGNPSIERPILYSQTIFQETPKRIINLSGLGHGNDDGSITIPNIATGDAIGGYFNPAAFNTQIGITGFDRLVMSNEFGGGVAGGGSGQVSEIKQGVYIRTTEDFWFAVIRVGDQAPEFEEGVTVVGASFATSNNLTDIIVTTSLSSGVTAFWRLDEFDDSLSLITSDDKPAPGFSGRDWSPGEPLIGFTDEVAFHGKATANGETDIDAIWLEVDNDGETTLDVIFEASEDGTIFYQTTEGSVTFLSLSEPLMGPDQQFYFFATGRDEGDVFVSGIWKLKLGENNEPESIDLLAATNAEAPGQLIDGLPMLFQDFELREVNAKGDLLFSATLFRNSNTRGSLWLSTPEAGLLAVAAEGDSLGSGNAAVTLDEFYFNEYAGALAERSVALGDTGTVVFLGLIPDGDDAGTSRDFALFRSEVNVPKYIWSGKANTDLWWDLSGETSNWDNDVGENWNTPPGAGGTESVEIGALASVKLDTVPANIGSLTNHGEFALTRALTVQFGAEIERMTLDADLIAHGEVKLIGEDNRWLSGAMSGDSGATVEFGSVFTIAPRNSAAIALQTTLNASGKVVHENELVTLEESGIDQEGSIQIGLLGEYEIGAGTITDLTGGVGKISNGGVFRKTGSGTGSVNARYESTLGKIAVEGGTLQLKDEVDFKGLDQAVVSGNSLLEIGNANSETESSTIDIGMSASGAGTLRLAHGLSVEIGDEAEAVFGLTGFDGEGLEIADATVSGEGALLIGNDQFISGRATFLDATFDSLGDGLVNNNVLQIGAEGSEGQTALNLNKTQFVNNGVVNQYGDVDIFPAEPGATAIDNHGTYSLPDTGDIFASESILDYIFNNATDGRVEKKGSGSSRVEANFISRGNLDIGSGTLVLRFGSEFHLNSKITFGGGAPAIAGILELGELGLDFPTEIAGSVTVETLGNQELSHELRIFSGLNLGEGAVFEIDGVKTNWSGGEIQGPESSLLKASKGSTFSILPGSTSPRVLNAPFENHGTLIQSATLSSGADSIGDAHTFSSSGDYMITADANIEALELILENSPSFSISDGVTSNVSSLRINNIGSSKAASLQIGTDSTLTLGSMGDGDRFRIESSSSNRVFGDGTFQIKDTVIEMSESKHLFIVTENALFEKVQVVASPEGFISFPRYKDVSENESPVTIKETAFNNITLKSVRPVNLEGDIVFNGGEIILDEQGRLNLDNAILTNAGEVDIAIDSGFNVVEMKGVSSLGSVDAKFSIKNAGKLGLAVRGFSTATVNAQIRNDDDTVVPYIVNGELKSTVWFVDPEGVLQLDSGAPISSIGSDATVSIGGSGTFNNLPNVVGNFSNDGFLTLRQGAQFDVSGTFTNNGMVVLDTEGSIDAQRFRGDRKSILSGKSGTINGDLDFDGYLDPGDSAVDDSNPVTRLASIGDNGDGPIALHGGASLGVLATLAELNGDAIGVITINGDFTQSATSVLALDLAGSNPEEQDRLIVNGTATLAGTLRISAADTIPVDGATFAPITATSIEGGFEDIVFDVPTGRVLFDVAIGDTGVTASANVLDVSTFAEWQAGVFTTEEQADEAVSGLMADPDEDGLVNLLEYALDGNPRVWTPALVGIDIGTNAEGTLENVIIEFPWANGMTDVDYHVEYSTDLANWTTLETVLVDSEELELTTVTTLSGSVALQSGESLFARLVVSQL